MRNHSNNEGTVAKRKFMSVCPFGLIEFYCEDIIDCKLCAIIEAKISFFIEYLCISPQSLSRLDSFVHQVTSRPRSRSPKDYFLGGKMEFLLTK